MDWFNLFLKLAPLIVQAGQQAIPLFNALMDSIRKNDGEGPTPVQLENIARLETMLRASLHEPVPDE